MNTLFAQTLQLLRVSHWIKNLVILGPVFFAGNLTDILIGHKIIVLTELFFAFCFASSFIYVVNDLVDIKSDSQHPEKKFRPIASGFFSKTKALTIGFGCLVISSCLMVALRENALLVGIYVMLNLLYCFYLKNIPILDIACISLGFVLRVTAGGFATEVFLSHWIIIMTFLLSFSIALAKRRDDLILQKDNDLIFRKSQKGYNLTFIDTAKSISFSVTLVSYIMYSISSEVMKKMDSQYVYLTSLPVFLAIIRYLQLSIVEEKSGSPVKLLMRDSFLLSMVVIWIIAFSIIIYGKNF